MTATDAVTVPSKDSDGNQDTRYTAKTMFISKLLPATLVIGLAVFSVSAQKGVDAQSQKIQKDATRTTEKGNDVSRTWDFGPGKTKVIDRLPNPLRLTSRRDALLQSILDVIQESRMVVDEASSRPSDGILVTQPYVFAKGAVITRNELGRYAQIVASDAAWTRGRYTLTIEVQSIDGIQNNVSVSAKVEGRSENGLLSEWNTLQSSGAAEEEFLKKLLAAVTGQTPEEFLPKQ